MSNMKGIDISAYQPTVDFAKVKAAGYDVSYIKATEGTNYTNPYLKSHAAAAKAAGIKVGFYHFFRAKSEANAEAQAKFFADAISGLSYDCRPALDIETTESLSKDALNRCAKAFLDKVVSLTGKSPVLYSYTSFINSYLTSVLQGYPLWVADYKSGSPSSNSVWGTNWIGWQHSGTGAVSGIAGKVDLDIFTNDILNTDTMFNYCIDQLMKDNVLVSGDYWKNAIASGTVCRGEYVAAMMMKMTNQSTLQAAVQKLTSAGVLASPDYWLANAVSGKTCDPTYVRALVVNGVKLLGL